MSKKLPIDTKIEFLIDVPMWEGNYKPHDIYAKKGNKGRVVENDMGSMFVRESDYNYFVICDETGFDFLVKESEIKSLKLAPRIDKLR